MPTILSIDSYSEEKVANKNWLNNKILYQKDIIINNIATGTNFYDTKELFNELDQLYMLEGICYVPSAGDYKIFSDKTSDIRVTYDKETGYLKIVLSAYTETTNNVISFYYTKSETRRLRISQNTEQEQGNYYPVVDVYVNGDTVLDASRIAQIKSYKEVTQAEYNALPASKRTDGIMYCIKDSAGGGIDTGVVDVQLNGVSIVDDNGYANITGLASATDLNTKQNLLVQGSNITLEPLVDGTVRISAAGGGSGSDILDVTVNGTSVVSNNVAAIVQPTALSQLANDTDFIDNTVNNLTNYYSKTATDNKIDEKIAAIPIVGSNTNGLMSPSLLNKLNNVISDVMVDGISVIDQNNVAVISLSNKQNTLTASTGIQIDSILNTISTVPMTGATANTNGVSGAVPQPYISDRDKYLKGDGTWAEVTKSLSELTDVAVITPADGETLVYDNTNSIWINRTIGGNIDDVQSDGVSIVDSNKVAHINTMVGATASTNSEKGLVPIATPAERNQFLKGDGTWDTISGIGNLEDLGNVNITSPTDGQTLVYNLQNQEWVNGSGGGGAYLHNYSIIEHEIGTWIDGKTLYEKTIETTEIPNNQIKYIAHDISNIDTIVHIEGIMHTLPSIEPNNQFTSLPRVQDASSNANLAIDVNATYILLKGRTQNFAAIFDKAWITIQYTKTAAT